MNIAAVCRRRVVSIDEQGSLASAARLMREHHVGSLVVTRDGRDGLQVCGLLSDRDLVIDALARGLYASPIAVGNLVSAPAVSVGEDEDVETALAIMRGSGVNRLLVVDTDRQVTGIVSLDDLMDACASLFAGLGEVIRTGIRREVAGAQPPPSPPVLRIPAMGTLGWGQPAV